MLAWAWISYSGDYDGNLVHNTHGGEAQSTVPTPDMPGGSWVGWTGACVLTTPTCYMLRIHVMPSWQHFRETVKTWFTAPRTNTLVPLRKRRDGPNESEPSPWTPIWDRVIINFGMALSINRFTSRRATLLIHPTLLRGEPPHTSAHMSHTRA